MLMNHQSVLQNGGMDESPALHVVGVGKNGQADTISSKRRARQTDKNDLTNITPERHTPQASVGRLRAPTYASSGPAQPWA